MTFIRVVYETDYWAIMPQQHGVKPCVRLVTPSRSMTTSMVSLLSWMIWIHVVRSVGKRIRAIEG
jgi:hypothetical protein